MAIRFSIETAGVTRTYEVKRSVVTFGRSGASTVTIEDPALSRTHCQFELEDGVCFVRDLNSRNGTLLEDERVNRVALVEGDLVRIGNSKITFHGDAVTGLESAAGKTAGWTARLFRQTKVPPKEPEATDALRLRRLLGMVKSISSELEPERVLTRVLDAAIEFAEAERGFLVLRDGASLSIPVARDFWKKDIVTPAFELSRSIALEVVRRAEPLVTDDASGDDRFDEAASVYDLQIRSVLCVPLSEDAPALGAIYLDNRFSRGVFENADLDAMALFAEQAALAVGNSHQFDRVRERGDHWEKEARRERREREQLRLRVAQLERAEGLRHAYPEIVGRSPAMLELLRLSDRVAEVDLPLLLVGESGTGKELLARAIHINGPRKERGMVTVDAASLVAGLAEVELFGHAAGAFTDGGTPKAGLLELAHRGTLFLDEVADLGPEVQAALLRVLETGEVRRIGAAEPRSVDLRVIAATRCDLEAEVVAGRFREDLYFRLKGVRIDLPPLRERLEDLGALVEFLDGQAALDSERAPLEWEAEAMRALARYPWPGNVRELKHEIARLRLLADTRVTIADLNAEILRPPADSPRDSESVPLKGQVEALERRRLEEALRACEGNKTRAAEQLGLSRLGLRKKMTRYGLLPSE